MAETTHIEWTGATWNPITGCMVKSPGCLRCYAMTLAGTRLKHHPSRAGLTREVNGHHVWTGEVRFNEQWLDQPLRWKRPRDIFVVAHGDLFYERVTDEMLDQVFAVVFLARQHRFQILTKRPDRAVAYLSGCTSDNDGMGFVRDNWTTLWHRRDFVSRAMGKLTARNVRYHDYLGHVRKLPPSNIWIGTSVERQQEADERRPYLEVLARMGWNTWVSYEPAIGPVDWSGWEFIKWMVSGGESGPDARPTDPVWHQATRDWCAENSIPFFFKQWGSWHADALRYTDMEGRCPPPNMKIGKKAAGHLLYGVEYREFPT